MSALAQLLFYINEVENSYSSHRISPAKQQKGNLKKLSQAGALILYFAFNSLNCILKDCYSFCFRQQCAMSMLQHWLQNISHEKV